MLNHPINRTFYGAGLIIAAAIGYWLWGFTGMLIGLFLGFLFAFWRIYSAMREL